MLVPRPSCFRCSTLVSRHTPSVSQSESYLIARLKLATDESGKPRDIDLAQLLVFHECACSSVHRLLRLEQHAVRLVSLYYRPSSAACAYSLFLARSGATFSEPSPTPEGAAG